MSWAEIMKITSDMSEPLNHIQYINNISMFGEDSYVLSAKNSSIWNNFCVKSLYLYSHTQLHDLVYNRLDDGNIDDLFEHSSVLGTQLNYFFDIDIFPNGSADDICSVMNDDIYDALGDKFKSGYLRYINKKLSSSECGKWVNDTFNLHLPVLNSYTQTSELLTYLISNNILYTNSSLLFGIARSDIFTPVISTIDTLLFISALETVPPEHLNILFSNTYAIDSLIVSEKITDVLNNQILFNTFVGNYDSLILYKDDIRILEYIKESTHFPTISTNNILKTSFYSVLFESNTWMDEYFMVYGLYTVLSDPDIAVVLNNSENGLEHITSIIDTDMINFIYS